jgi:hypothetical protein
MATATETALKIKADKCLIGADPEFFVQRNGHIIPAHDFGFGTKSMPMKTPNGSVQVDGLALEVNVTPAGTRNEFIKNVFSVITDLSHMVQHKDPLYKLTALPSVNIGIKKIKDLPPYAQRLGCEPDFDAYIGEKNPLPNAQSPYRTGSGHLHLGWTENAQAGNFRHLITCRRLVKNLDYYVGLVTLLFDNDNRRRSLYGKAGAHRPKKYGVEYRVPSNKWTQDAKLAGLMFDQAQKAFRAYQANIFLDEEFKGFARSMINTGNSRWGSLNSAVRKEVLG